MLPSDTGARVTATLHLHVDDPECHIWQLGAFDPRRLPQRYNIVGWASAHQPAPCKRQSRVAPKCGSRLDKGKNLLNEKQESKFLTQMNTDKKG